jgi:ankyrin repeat protein
MGIDLRGLTVWAAVVWAAVLSAGLAAAPRQPPSRPDILNASEPDGTTELHRAAQHDDVKRAEQLILAGADVKAANRYGVTPLSVACINGNAAMIELMLKSGADPNTVLPGGESALMTTANSGSVAGLRVLLSHGANVNAHEDSRGQTALMWAANEGHTEAAQLLIEAGANISARSKASFSPMVFAVRGGHMEIVKVLLAAGANANEDVAGAAVSSGSAEGGATSDSTSLMGLAILNGQYDIARLLLARGADPNAPDSRGSLLHTLAWMRRPGTGRRDPAPDPVGDSLELAKAMLAHGAKPNVRIAWEEIPFDIDEGEAKSPPNISAGRDYLIMTGATPFFLAAKNGDVGLMRVLVANGADPRTPNVLGVTPFMAAAGLGYWAGEASGPTNGTSEAERLEAVKLALELSGEDVNGTADFGGDLQFDEDPDVLRFRYPVRYSADPSADAATRNLRPEAKLGDVRWAGSTALHGAAALNGQLSIIRFLVEKGARLDVRNKLGWTPLMITQGMVIGANLRFLPTSEALLKELMVERGMDPAQYSHRAVTTTIVR